MGSDGFDSKRFGESGASVHGRERTDAFSETDRSAGSLAGLGEGTHLVEIRGVIKWFDASKGYGFIIPDDGAPDVLLHVTCLRQDGFQTAHEGARIVCEAVRREKGMQAFHILSMDESTAVRPPQTVASRTHTTVTPTSGLERATVKWFNRVRGGSICAGWMAVDSSIETIRKA